MTKKVLLSAFALALFVAAFVSWKLLWAGTGFNKDKYYLYIKTGMSYDGLLDLLKKDTVIKSPYFFDLLSKQRNYPANIKAGKYEIKKGMNLVSIVRMLKNGRQAPVRLVITKLRT
ncbi:MAG: endolytic transglycosylase MltG, partial [Bacteroidetes bacterium]|nr:endolytic transglycosylase MltG [Bacteroidota bacterium]